VSAQPPEPRPKDPNTQHSQQGQHDPHLATPVGKPRARALGLRFRGRPGRWNAITDVPGLEVGYRTLIQGDSVRTGVTAIHPRGKGNPGDPVAAGFHSQNGNGEMTGVSWIEESGTCQGPIAITNTHAVGIAHAGIIAWMKQYHPEFTKVWLLPVAAETWDGYLNDINGHHVTEDIVISALEDATHSQPDEGSVGGGTGMNCYQFKAGSGTASRLVDYANTGYTVGVFVQANFGKRYELMLTGIALGEEFAADNPMRDSFNQAPAGAGSVIAVVATDAPLFPSQCKALARRVTVGLARTGTSGSHFSGDLFLAFSTANPGAFTPSEPSEPSEPGATTAPAEPGPETAPAETAPAETAPAEPAPAEPAPAQATRYDRLTFIPWGYLDPFFEAVVQATEEAVANSLVANEEMVGRQGHRSPVLPRDRLAEIVAARNA